MSIKTRLRAIESNRRKAHGGFSLVEAHPDGTYTVDGTFYPNEEALDRMMKRKPRHMFHFSHVPEPDPVPPELAAIRPRHAKCQSNR